LRAFEHEEDKKTELVKALKKGENSGFVDGFDRKVFLNKLHQKHLSENDV
jgi:antitoxin ParD1/3/4